MNLHCTVNPFIPVTNQRHLVYALVEIDPGTLPTAKTTAAALNVGLVVDASESMSIPILTEQQFRELSAKGMAKKKVVDGVSVWQFEVPRGFKMEAPSNLDFTVQALHAVADRLRREDHFSLVAFAEDALLMVPNTSGNNVDLLRQAAKRLQQIDLGDETFMARGMEQCLAQIQGHTADDTVSRMIVLTDGYTKDSAGCREWVVQAQAQGVTVSTMGLGLDFNEELLIDLAEASGGHSYFIQDPAEIPAAFAEEMSAAQSVTWRDLTLSLSLPTDVVLRRAHRASPTIAHIAANPDAIPLGDLEAGQPPSVLLELVVPPRPVGSYRLAEAMLQARPASGGPQEVSQADILVRYTERPSEAQQTDPQLMAAVQRVSAFKLQNQAMEDARQGNVAGATRRLRRAGEHLIEMGQQDLGQTMLSEAQRIEEDGKMSSEGTKKLRYGTRKLSRPKK
jgi:Ca-activated chloride channel family protein